MHKQSSAFTSVLYEMQLIQAQLYVAKNSTKNLYTPLHTLLEVQSHINHALYNLEHLIKHTKAYHENDKLQTSNRDRKY